MVFPISHTFICHTNCFQFVYFSKKKKKKFCVVQVILATNIAESSVTIPKVAFVIDSCRSLQVFWDSNCKKESTELVWVSKSQVMWDVLVIFTELIFIANCLVPYLCIVLQAEQRRGRTGRTCDGQVYRFVTSSFFGNLKEFEPPSILRLSLRQQVLLISCAESKVINDPRGMVLFHFLP